MPDDKTPNIFQDTENQNSGTPSNQAIPETNLDDQSSITMEIDAAPETDTPSATNQNIQPLPENNIELQPAVQVNQILNETKAEPNLQQNAQIELTTQTEQNQDLSTKLSTQDLFMSVLCYGNLLVFIPLMNMPKDEYTRFHLRQGIAVTVMDLFLFIFVGFISGFLGRILGDLFFFFFFLIPFLGGHGFLAYKAFLSEKFEIPYIGKNLQKIDLSKLDLAKITSTSKKTTQTEQNNNQTL